jgi:hypothetical protein
MFDNPQSPLVRTTLLVLATSLTLLLPGGASAQVKHYPLEATDGLRLHNVAAEPAVLQGKKGLRVTFSEETVRRFKELTPEEQAEAQARVDQYAIIEGLEFSNGVIEAAHPDWPWFRLRKEIPSKYESYVDLLPGVWTKIKIEVRGDRARLYVHGQEQPTLIVNDLKSGARSRREEKFA